MLSKETAVHVSVMALIVTSFTLCIHALRVEDKLRLLEAENDLAVAQREVAVSELEHGQQYLLNRLNALAPPPEPLAIGGWATWDAGAGVYANRPGGCVIRDGGCAAGELLIIGDQLGDQLHP